MIKKFIPLLCILGLIMGIAVYAGVSFVDETKEDALILKIALEDERVMQYLRGYPNYTINKEIKPQTRTTCHYEEGKEICNSTTYPGVWFDLNSGYIPEDYLLVRVDTKKKNVVDIRHFP